jgi:hypothetical protein
MKHIITLYPELIRCSEEMENDWLLHNLQDYFEGQFAIVLYWTTFWHSSCAVQCQEVWRAIISTLPSELQAGLQFSQTTRWTSCPTIIWCTILQLITVRNIYFRQRNWGRGLQVLFQLRWIRLCCKKGCTFRSYDHVNKFWAQVLLFSFFLCSHLSVCWLGGAISYILLPICRSDVTILSELNHPNIVKLHLCWNELGKDYFGCPAEVTFTSMLLCDRYYGWLRIIGDYIFWDYS